MDATNEQIRTIRDCAICPDLKDCDAHITGGLKKHREGPNPCRVVD